MHLSAQRAREINDYYHSLGEGLGQFTPPLVEQVDSNKPLSIALEEVAAGKIVAQYPGDARRAAEELLGSGDDGTDAAIFALPDAGGDDFDIDATPVDEGHVAGLGVVPVDDDAAVTVDDDVADGSADSDTGGPAPTA